MRRDLEDEVRVAVEDAGFEVIDLSLARSQRRLRLVADRHPEGIDIGDCADISRDLGDVLAGRGQDPAEWEVEVASPGLDRLLTRPEHWERFRGQTARIEIHGLIEGRGTMVGTIEEVTDEGVEIEEERAGRLPIRWDEIEEARLIPDLSAFSKGKKKGGKGKNG